MSIHKLLGTGACMVIIGVSAGVSYGQFQRLTAHVVPAEPAMTASAHSATVPADQPVRADFVSASVTTWTPAPASEVTQPQLIKPVVQTQPEPPLVQFTAHDPAADLAVTPTLAPAELADTDTDTPMIVPDLPSTQTAAISATPLAIVRKPIEAPRGIELASKPNALPTPGDLRRTRLQSVATTSGRDDGTFEQEFPPRTALKSHRPSALSAGTRAAQRVARFERLWVTGVYR